jgi:hypothetical protein
LVFTDDFSKETKIGQFMTTRMKSPIFLTEIIEFTLHRKGIWFWSDIYVSVKNGVRFKVDFKHNSGDDLLTQTLLFWRKQIDNSAYLILFDDVGSFSLWKWRKINGKTFNPGHTRKLS